MSAPVISVVNLNGRFVVDATVWTIIVVEVFPVGYDHFCLFEVQEQFPIHAVVPKAAVKTFHPRVFPRTTRLDIHRLDLVLLQPVTDLVGDKLWSVIGADELRGSVDRDGLLNEPYHIHCPNLLFHCQMKTVATILALSYVVTPFLGTSTRVRILISLPSSVRSKIKSQHQTSLTPSALRLVLPCGPLRRGFLVFGSIVIPPCVEAAEPSCGSLVSLHGGAVR